MGSQVRNRLVCFVVVATLASAGGVRESRASGPEELTVDASALSQMEARVATAEPRDRCFLYTELLHNWTELAGREMAAGDEAAATMAVQHADDDAARLKAAIDRDSRRLKNAELLLEHSVHRLSDMLHASPSDQRDSLQAVLRHVTSVHDDLLAAVFTH